MPKAYLAEVQVRTLNSYLKKQKEVGMILKKVLSELQWHCQGRFNIRNYAKNYLRDCLGESKPVQLLTIWCLSRSLTKRFSENNFIPLSAEIKVIKDLKWCHELLAEAGLLVNNFIFLVGSGVENGQIPAIIKTEYLQMIQKIIDEYDLDALIDIRPAADPDGGILARADELLINPALIKEVERRLRLAENNKYFLTKKQAYNEAIRSVAVKAGEAKELVSEFGDFILTPLEHIERYQFHNFGITNFIDRLLPINQPYPWRLHN